MQSGIYEIVNITNGKRYIGSAKDFGKRWGQHRCRLANGNHHSRHLQSAWNMYGAEAFSFEPIIFCAQENLLLYEQIAIDSMSPEYNVLLVAGSSLGRKATPETRAKIAEKARGRLVGPRSEQHRAKLSAAHKGRLKSPEHMAALQAGRANRQYTPDVRAAIGESLKLAYASGARSREKTEEHRKKIAETVSKLTAEQVRMVRREHAAGATGRSLAARFSVPTSTISLLVRGITYQWVPDERPAHGSDADSPDS